MSKDTVEFPWRSQIEEPAPPSDNESAPKTGFLWLDFIKKYQVPIGCGIAILLLTITLNREKKSNLPAHTTINSSQISVVVPVVAFPKGTTLDPTLLKPIIASSKSFTRLQLLSIFTEDDIERVNDRLIAKKDLAPYRPIFWNALELKRIPKTAPRQVQILYPTEEGKSP